MTLFESQSRPKRCRNSSWQSEKQVDDDCRLANFVQLGAPANAFDEDGILDVDQLIELGWTIDDNAESFDPPGESVEDTEQPE